MKKKIITLIIAITCLSFTGKSQNTYLSFRDSITLNSIKSHVYHLASTEMAGRETGKKGQKLAANYISSYFREQGLDSLNLSNYYQPFDLVKNNNGNADLWIQFNSEKYPDVHKVRIYAGAYANSSFNINDSLPLTYLGFGREVETRNLKNHVIIVLLDETLEKTHENISKISSTTGAELFVILFKEDGKWYTSKTKTMNKLENTYEVVNLINRTLEGSLPYKHEECLNKFNPFLETFGKQDLCVFYAFQFNANRLFGVDAKTLYKAELTKLKKPDFESYKPILDSTFCIVKTQVATTDTIPTENVIAYIPGTDKKSEVIIVSAHYDHTGQRNDTTINYGADDNASGTVAIMEIATAMQKTYNMGFKPKRSVAFVAFSGEEIGLIGSHYFVRNSPFNLDSIVLNLNLDMIGRNKNDKEKFDKTAFVIANGKNSRYVKYTSKKAVNKNVSIKLSSHPGFKERLSWSFSSDHFRFKQEGIPIACYFTGLHGDYHTPRDTPDKINYPKLTEVAKLGYQTVWELANTEKELLSKHKPAKNKE